MEILTLVTWLTSAAKLLKDAGANEMVKEGAKSVFSWLKEKFKRNSEQEKIDKIVQTPDNEDAMKDFERMIFDVEKDNSTLFAALQEQINNFSILVTEKMPETASFIKTQIEGNGNIVISAPISHINISGGDFHIGHNKSADNDRKP